MTFPIIFIRLVCSLNESCIYKNEERRLLCMIEVFLSCSGSDRREPLFGHFVGVNEVSLWPAKGGLNTRHKAGPQPCGP